MPIDLKNSLNGGLDLDTSDYLLPKDKYRDALNITLDAIEGSQDNNITNIVGNQRVTYSYPAGTGKVIGAFPFTLRNTIIFFRYNSLGYNGIYEYDRTNEVITKIFESLTDSDTDILNFTQYDKITSVNVFPRESGEGDLLFFLDSLGRPTTLNIQSFKAGLYTPVTRDIIDVGKIPPLSPPDVVYANDTSRRVNNLRNKLFRFKTLFVYDDFEESTTSPISAVPLPVKVLDETYTNVITNNNLINLSFDSGDKNVKSIRLLVSFVNKTNVLSAFLTVAILNKEEYGIDDNSPFPYSFYNDSTYPLYDVNRSIELFDWVPESAYSQEMGNGNTLEYGGVEEGLDRTIDPNVVNTISTIAAGNGGTIGSLNGIRVETDEIVLIKEVITFTGIPATGTTVNIKLKRKSDNVILIIGTYTTLSGDVAFDVANALRLSLISIGLIFGTPTSAAGVLTFRFVKATYDFNALEILPPALGAAVNSIPTWKWSTEREIGIAYFNKKGKTNGILYHNKITFPAYAEDMTETPLIPYINTKVYHVPPLWSYSYQFLFTKEPTQYLFFETVEVNISETDYLYFNVSDININAIKNPTTASVLNYSFVDGDRMRLIRKMDDGTVYADTYDAAIIGYLSNPKISNVETPGEFLKISKIAPFSSVDYSSKYFVIEIYRSGQQSAGGIGENETFYEFGEQYPILNPETEQRVHGGQVTNQSEDYVTPAEFNFYEGDSYFRSRTVALSETGIGTFNVQDRNFVDFYTSAVNSIQGRPNLIDENSRPTFFPAVIRFSQAYVPNTNINGLNRFPSVNLFEVDASAGIIKRMGVRDRQLVIFQEYRTGFSPLFSQIQKDGANNVVVQTDKLLNPVQYYSGNWGIGTASESLVYFNYSFYFCDTNKGVMLRLSKDGLTPISTIYKINSWGTTQIPLRTGNYKIYGAYDQKINNYICALEATDTEPAYTIAFNENANHFESFLSYKPEMMCTLGTLLVTFKNGELYTHDSETYNNFYNVQYPSTISLLFNSNPQIKKTFNAISYQSNEYWVSDIEGDILTSNINPQTNLPTISKLRDFDYELQENVRYAAFLRDINSNTDSNIALYEGDYLKGVWIRVNLRCPSTSANKLVFLTMIYVNNEISQRNL